MEKKYEMTEETMTLDDGTVLHRIRALQDFCDVKKGDLGGFIEKEENLSQYGACWVYDDAKVYNDAKVYGEARVYNNAKVYGNAQIYNFSTVMDIATIFDNAKIYDVAIIRGDAEIFGCANVAGYTRVGYNANISSANDVFCVGPIGSGCDDVTFYKSKDNSIRVVCKWFYCGTINEFENQVNLMREDKECVSQRISAIAYLSAIKFAKENIGQIKDNNINQ